MAISAVVNGLLLTWVAIVGGFVVGLRMDYYLTTCPFVDLVVKNAVFDALQADPTLAAGLVRIYFHDCFIQGCDASVLLDSTKDNAAEKDSPVNFSLRGYEVIDDVKEQLEALCPGVVSCADIVAMAARDAVFFSGGPIYDIPKGRKDGRISQLVDTFFQLPGPSNNASRLIRLFGQNGFTAKEMVALSGAHTLGVARCVSFKPRLSDFDSAHKVDPSIDPGFAKTLASTCSRGDNAVQAFDATRNDFDNEYFNALVKRAGVMSSDQTLWTSAATRGYVHGYAMNQEMFFLDFKRAMVKMSVLDVKEGAQGEVRSHCRKIND